MSFKFSERKLKHQNFNKFLPSWWSNNCMVDGFIQKLKAFHSVLKVLVEATFGKTLKQKHSILAELNSLDALDDLRI